MLQHTRSESGTSRSDRVSVMSSLRRTNSKSVAMGTDQEFSPRKQGSKSELSAISRIRSSRTKSTKCADSSPPKVAQASKSISIQHNPSPVRPSRRTMQGSEEVLAAAHMAWARGGANGHIK